MNRRGLQALDPRATPLPGPTPAPLPSPLGRGEGESHAVFRQTGTIVWFMVRNPKPTIESPCYLTDG